MKTLKITLLFALINTGIYSQSYINNVLGKYVGTVYRDGCSSVATTNGVLYLVPSNNYTVAVIEGDSSSFGYLSEPWDIQVNADSTLIRYPGATQTDSSAALGRLFKNDSIHLRVTVFGSPFCHRIFDGFKLYSTAGVKEFSYNISLSVAPNPASSSITVSGDQLSDNSQIKVIDVLGCEVINYKLKVVNATDQIDVSNLPDGIYFVTLKTLQGSGTQKIIVQH